LYYSWLIVGWIIYTWPTFSSLKPDLFSDVSSDIESSSSYVNKGTCRQLRSMCDVDVIENSLELSTMMFVSTVFIKSGSFVKKTCITG
jgi:hypothetical protein